MQIVKNIPHGMPPFSANQWAPISNIDKLLPLAFIVMAVDMLESTSIARALARKNSYGGSLGLIATSNCVVYEGVGWGAGKWAVLLLL